LAGQPGFFDRDERLRALSAAGDPLERLAQVVDFEVFRDDLEAALSRPDRTKEGLNKALRGWGSIEIAAAKDSAGLSLSALV